MKEQKLYKTCSCCKRVTWHVNLNIIYKLLNIFISFSTDLIIYLNFILGPYTFSLQATIDHHALWYSMHCDHYTISVCVGVWCGVCGVVCVVCVVWCGVCDVVCVCVWCGVCGVVCVWCGVCDVVWCGVCVWCMWCGVVWCGVVCVVCVWCGVVWCGVVWCGVVCVCANSISFNVCMDGLCRQVLSGVHGQKHPGNVD